MGLHRIEVPVVTLENGVTSLVVAVYDEIAVAQKMDTDSTILMIRVSIPNYMHGGSKNVMAKLEKIIKHVQQNKSLELAIPENAMEVPYTVDSKLIAEVEHPDTGSW